jgi:hypothetical protein
VKTLPKQFPDKTVGESKVYALDFRAALAGDTISTATWASTPTGLTFAGDTLSDSSRKANVTISGGTAGTEYTVSCVVVTVSSGETYEARAELYVRRDDEG